MANYSAQRDIKKLSFDESSNERRLSYGVSNMQRWCDNGASQESAHTCILEFDNNTSLFGVYDGHGSHGTAEQLPKFLKTVESYKHDDLAKALEEALSKFDQTVTESNFGKIHHPIVIAGNKSKEDASEDDHDEVSDLYEEAAMSIHELNGRFGNQNEVAAGEQAKGYKSPCVNSSPPAIAIVSSKENGLAKGLSSNSRKVEEKTFDEIEKEKRTSERIAKRQEGKASFGNKSEDALRRTMITNDEEEDTDEHNSDVSADDEEELEDLDDEGEGEEHGEKDPAEMTAMAKSFAINTKKEPGSDSGCYALLSLLRGNTLYVANVGNSHCVLSRQGRVILLSAEQKPEEEPEMSTIEETSGGVVTDDVRVNDGLNLTRAIEDRASKQKTDVRQREKMMTALPKVQSIELQDGDDFFVQACDGIWNSKTNQQVVDFIRLRLSQSMSLSQICEELMGECLAPNTSSDDTGCDQMTAIIVRLDRFLTDEATSPAQKWPLPVEDSTEALRQDDGAKRQQNDESDGETSFSSHNEQGLGSYGESSLPHRNDEVEPVLAQLMERSCSMATINQLQADIKTSEAEDDAGLDPPEVNLFQVSTISQLPNELLDYVAKHLNAADLLSFSATCRRFSEVSHKLRKINFENSTFNSLSIGQKATSNLYRFLVYDIQLSLLKSCNLNGLYWIRPGSLEQFLRRCHKLESLSVADTSLPFNRIIENILPHCKKITSLSFTLRKKDLICHDPKLLKGFKRLLSVEVIMENGSMYSVLRNFLQNCPNLEHLVVSKASFYPLPEPTDDGGEGDDFILTNLPKLKSFIFMAHPLVRARHRPDFNMVPFDQQHQLTMFWSNVHDIPLTDAQLQSSNLIGLSWNPPRNQQLPHDIRAQVRLPTLSSVFEPFPIFMQAPGSSPQLKLVSCTYDGLTFQTFCLNHQLLEVLKLTQ